MAQIRTEIRFKNKNFFEARTKKNLSQIELAKKVNISNTVINAIENLRWVPKRNSDLDLKICIELESTYEYLFEPYRNIKNIEKRIIYFDTEKMLPINEIKYLPTESDNIDFEHDIKEALNTLTNREKDFVIKYFGLLGMEKYSLEDLADEYNLTRERVRQIKEKALRRLRHESRSKILRKYV